MDLILEIVECARCHAARVESFPMGDAWAITYHLPDESAIQVVIGSRSAYADIITRYRVYTIYGASRS